MTLPALATIDDVAARMPRAVTNDEMTRSQTLLVDASSRVRGFTRQAFSVTQTTVKTPIVDNQIILSQLPVIQINAVGRVNADGETVMPFSLWTFDGISRIMLAPPTAVVNAPEYWIDNDWFWRNVTYQVTYTHGFQTIPDDVVGIVANMVVRVLLAPGTPGIQSETIGGYSYRIQDGYPVGMVSLTSDDERALARYMGRRNRTIEIR